MATKFKVFLKDARQLLNSCRESELIDVPPLFQPEESRCILCLDWKLSTKVIWREY
ncbi:hypothetical protein OU5_P0140 (plasmid) [Pseudomonas mandelii JR-1]|uniref:Uncharacterized protein n=1 Tax=Pseudomonas mandelii JR-1 TaxID=1147786 RepID=A0A024EKS0_9PSED|nr:hypothetical protein OU5_P0140 [Pseudomonas mandelii JR-1]